MKSRRNLSVRQDLNEIPQSITDQDSNTSGLFITNAATGIASIPANGRFVLGIAPFGIGEWIQNSQNGVGFSDDLNKILSLNPVSFQFKHTGDTGLGYIAEDLQEKDLTFDGMNFTYCQFPWPFGL